MDGIMNGIYLRDTWGRKPVILFINIKTLPHFVYVLPCNDWLSLITHGASEASGVRNAKILAFGRENFVYRWTKNITSSYVSILSFFEIVEIISPNTWEKISSASFAWTTDNFQSLLKGIFFGVCFLPFAVKHMSRTVRNPFYIHNSWEVHSKILKEVWLIESLRYC